MCGIVAIYAGQADWEQMVARLCAALTLMKERGPDGAGLVVRDGPSGTLSGVGMCRLRVRSTPAVEVPFHDTGGTVYAFNGEVYATVCDGQMLPVQGGVAEATVLHNPDACADGMWAMASLSDDGAVRVCRDPWGIKPLWLRSWSGAGGNQARMAASSVNVVRADQPSTSVRTEAVAQFLTCGRVLDGGSLWRGIRPLPRGGRAWTDTAVTEPEQAFSPVWEQARMAVARAASEQELGALVREAVGSSLAATLCADRVTGLAVSGGLDSTVLALHARDLRRTALRTVSIRVEGTNDGLISLKNLRISGAVPASWTHHVRIVRAGDYLQLLRRAITNLGQPTGLTSVPLYVALADTAAEAGVTVLLVGEGADEVWGGYRSYLALDERSTPEAFYLPIARHRVLDQLLSSASAAHARRALRKALPRESGPRAILRAERDMSLGPLLDRTDVLLMARSIEGRTPFLHGTGWAIAEQLPWTAMVGAGQTKRALRAAYREQLPEFLTERKIPFRAPWARWLANELAEDVLGVIADAARALPALGVNARAAIDVTRRGIAGDPEAARLTFSLCSLSIWAEMNL